MRFLISSSLELPGLFVVFSLCRASRRLNTMASSAPHDVQCVAWRFRSCSFTLQTCTSSQMEELPPKKGARLRSTFQKKRCCQNSLAGHSCVSELKPLVGAGRSDAVYPGQLVGELQKNEVGFAGRSIQSWPRSWRCCTSRRKVFPGQGTCATVVWDPVFLSRNEPCS